ncbi:MAG: alanine--tRNA ligase [Acidimicrobiales bacterium]
MSQNIDNRTRSQKSPQHRPPQHRSPRDSAELRDAFTGYFVERGHRRVPSGGLIPHHPAAPLLANAGMNQFIGILVGEEAAPDPPRATSVQKCFRTADIDIVGDTTRHLTFFEMLGNFSFGDYFKDRAIPMAWELVTGTLGLDPDRLWVTVHTSDDEAENIWLRDVGVPAERVSRLGDDNFWEMAKGGVGPCGPCSEIYWDKGPDHGPPGGPEVGGPERYVEIWNLVFMQYQRSAEGRLDDLPRRNIDTGAGLERILPILTGAASVFETDVLAPVVAAASESVGRAYGQAEKTDRSLRIMADHGRAMTILLSDGVSPSNEDRGYVLRRIIRRAVRHGVGLGATTLITPALVEATVGVLGVAYPDLVVDRDAVVAAASREEERFRSTLKAGTSLLDEALDPLGPGAELDGAVAFKLHDTYGFPLELTLEVAGERGVTVDQEGFTRAMDAQRAAGRAARSKPVAGGGDRTQRLRQIVDAHGPTRFTGYEATQGQARILAVMAHEVPTAPAGPNGSAPREAAPARAEVGVEVFADVTPFYAEGGGQVGDTGWIVTAGGRARVIDTQQVLPGLWAHVAEVTEGQVEPGEDASLAVDVTRRAAIRRNHTGTHLLHWALREVLGSHVRQAGSLVAPDRLRFDFSHHSPVSAAQLAAIERLANAQILDNSPVRTYETSMDEARAKGAIAFFGDKYGDVVRVVEAGPHSVELCGGTHVDALGSIGPVAIVSESSIGANLRRLEAVTGTGSFDRFRGEAETLARAASLLRVAPGEVPDRIEKLLDDHRSLAEALRLAKRSQAGDRARDLAASAVDGAVVARCDGLGRDELRELALAVREVPGVRAVVLGGAPPGGGAALVGAVAAGSGLVASELIAAAAKLTGGGGGRSPDVAVAGGRDPSRLDEALDLARAAVSSGAT